MSRVLIHWQDLPPYGVACILSLRRRHRVETLVLIDRENPNVSFAREMTESLGPVTDITGFGSRALAKLAKDFWPDAALVGGWTRYARALARAVKASGGRVVAMCDNTYQGTWRQRVFPALRRAVLGDVYDAFWVPGRRARAYLERVGVEPARIWTGAYSTDLSPFRAASETRCPQKGLWPRQFLFVGQYIERKGVQELLEAFAAVRGEWELVMCGAGPLKPAIERARSRDARIRDLGFVQPAELPDIMRRAGVFVLPSRQDNWGVVLLEAAAAGLPILCSTGCGAADELVAEGRNGRPFAPRAVESLASALEWTVARSDVELAAMGRESQGLASPFDAASWADIVWERLLKPSRHAD